MQAEHKGRYQDIAATVATVVVHGMFLGFLLLNLSDIASAPKPEQLAESIPAQVVDELAIREEQKRLAEEDRRRQREEAERQAQLVRAEREARLAEERR
ncbi:MAG: cell envelope integrity protein TolA, partial [Candidatus Competibacter sp.]|nr:cell envelope integrity protein TolA [Candidatus Competibacter sp.]